ncbi:MAG TPA: cupin domain-containing protein, partial [Actinomycetota bacterium]|nr:cupin domain-containing protein [Actinomycetota bacterium]
MSPRHLVRTAGEATWGLPAALEGHVAGFRRWTVVDEAAGAVHTGFGVGEMDPGGRLDWHLHSYEESLFVLAGEVVLSTTEAAILLRPGDYALVPLGQAHALSNRSSGPARWAAMSAPQPRPDHGGDTYFVPALPGRDPVPVDVRDPRTRGFGHIEAENMDAAKQTQDMLAVSASMRTALLVYSGVTVKMMVDSDLGAELSTMFMVQNDEGGGAGPHDHPFEETYMILEGAVDATFDGQAYRLQT